MALDAQGSSFTLRSLRPFIGRAYESGALWSYEGGDMRQRFQRILIPPTLLLACSMVACTDTPGVVGGEPTLPDPTPRDLAIETLVERVSTLAGEALSVTCVVSENREQVRDVATLVTVDGQPLAETTDGVASLTLVTRGTYIVSCEGVDEPVRDEIGVAIEVLPAAPSRSKPLLAPRSCQLEPHSILPVVWKTLLATASRGYRNFQPRVASPGMVMSACCVSRRMNLTFRARGTLAGDYSVACAVGELVDDTPSHFALFPVLRLTLRQVFPRPLLARLNQPRLVAQSTMPTATRGKISQRPFGHSHSMV